MIPKIRDTYVGCPSGWWVTDPDTITHIEANSYRNLRGKLEQHRKNNGLSTDGLDEMISNQICKREPPEFCQEWPVIVADTLQTPQPSLYEMIGNFVSSISYWAAKGFPVVTQEVFNQRLAICRACPYFEAPAYFGGGKCKKCGCCGSYKPWMMTAKCPDLPARW